MDGQTEPLIEMRGRIVKGKWSSFTFRMTYILLPRSSDIFTRPGRRAATFLRDIGRFLPDNVGWMGGFVKACVVR